MRLRVHDYSGHPFQVQLSRELARRGHEVRHEFSTQYVTGHGDLEVRPDDPIGLRIEGVQAGRPIRKYDPLGRIRFELSYARAWLRKLEHEPFDDVIVLCNVPLFALAVIRRRLSQTGRRWVFWHQDIYSKGVNAEITRRLPALIARPLRRWVDALERRQVATAEGVVAIGQAFVRQYRQWGLSTDHVEVVPNWAPLDQLRPGDRNNVWAKENGLPEAAVRLMYAGTLGRKHNPLLLLELLDAARADGLDAHLTVCSEGEGADAVRAAAGDRPDVTILGFQPAERFSEVLASADVMIALLEPDAAQFSVPSKVLSYLAAGRPTVALVPQGNPAAEDVLLAGGWVSQPTPVGATHAARWLARTAASNPGAFADLGERARALAEQRFDIGQIGDRFEDVLLRAASVPQGVRVAPAPSSASTAAATATVVNELLAAEGSAA